MSSFIDRSTGSRVHTVYECPMGTNGRYQPVYGTHLENALKSQIGGEAYRIAIQSMSGEGYNAPPPNNSNTFNDYHQMEMMVRQYQPDDTGE